MKIALLLPVAMLAGCSSTNTETVAVPTPTPTIIVVVTTPTPTPTPTTAPARNTFVPAAPIQAPVAEVSAPIYRKGQSFENYASISLAAVDKASTQSEVGRMGLYWSGEASALRDEAQRSRVSGKYSQAARMEQAVALMDLLSDDAVNRARFLDGMVSEREYSANRRASGTSISLTARQLDRMAGTTTPQTPQEREGERTLKALKDSF